MVQRGSVVCVFKELGFTNVVKIILKIYIIVI